MGSATVVLPVNAQQVAAAIPSGFVIVQNTTTNTATVTAGALTDAQVATVLSGIVYDSTVIDNQTTIRQRLANHRTQLLNWIAANPNGAVLTAAQTLILAQMLIDLTDADLGLLNDTTGT